MRSSAARTASEHAELPEDGVMRRPPRRPGKPIMGTAIIWRTFFVGILLIVAVLLNMQATAWRGGSLAQGRAVAMNTLVLGQCLYILSCRHLVTSSLRLEALTSNPWVSAAVLLNCALQALITYTPGVQEVWSTAAIGGLDWLRCLAAAVVVMLLVEGEKAVGPRYIRPFVMPCIRVLFCRRRPTQLEVGAGTAAAAAVEAAGAAGAAATVPHR